ncbi:MAG: protein kinase [Planctomycetes bacterium]|nr:protein kinase [Planctomycetota bacterium]
MAISTRDDFLELLETSELLDAEQLAEAHSTTEGLLHATNVSRKLVQRKLISRWQANELLDGRQPRRIGNYQLLDLLDTHTSGPVYLAKHVQLDRQVVLKAFAKQGQSEISIEPLSQALSLAALDHRNLCHVYDLVCDDDTYYLVMEHVVGRSLQQIVDAEGPLSHRSTAGLIALAASALAHAHAQGVRHLNLGPDRLVIDSLGTLKLVDVGVAQLHALCQPAEAAQNTAQSAFLAPEQRLAEHPIDDRTDIYALGCVLRYALGQSPEPESPEADPTESTPDLVLDIDGQRPAVPAELANICHRMSAPLPEDRFGSADDVVHALESWIDNPALALPRGTPVDEESLSVVLPGVERKHRVAALKRSKPPVEKIAATGAVVAIALLAIVGGLLCESSTHSPVTRTYNRPPPTPPRPEPVENVTIPPRPPRVVSSGNPPKVSTNDVSNLPALDPPAPNREFPEPEREPRVPEVVSDKSPSQSLGSLSPESHSLEILTVSGPACAAGRYVKVQLAGKNHLSLAEVQVFDSNGANVALSSEGATATQSSIYQGKTVATRAIDDNTSGVPAHNSIATTNSDALAWWQVDLGRVISLSRIVIWGRTDCCSDQTSQAKVSLIAADGTTDVWSSSTKNMSGQFRRTFELGAAVELPAVAVEPAEKARMEMTALGKLNYDPAQVTLSLLGGDVASHELGTFKLLPSPTKTQPQRWIARFQDHEGKTAEIAEFILSDQELKFGWRVESKTIPEANCLRNCLLNLAAGKKTQLVALRTPLGGNHLRWGLFNKPDNETYKIPWLPKGGRLKLELLTGNIQLPPHEISKDVLNVESDLAVLTFSPPNVLPLTVGIRSYMEDTLLIGAQAQWTQPGGKQRDFNGQAMMKQRAQLLERIKVAAAAKRHAEFKAAADQLYNLSRLADQIEAAGPLPFRVVMNVEGRDVVVLQSDRKAWAEASPSPAPAE